MAVANPSRLCMIYATFPTIEAARNAAQNLLRERLSACCNIFPAIESHYLWEGELQVAPEIVMLCKTTSVHAAAAIANIAANHPYETPAILQFPIESGAEKFIDWVEKVTAATHA